jgi:hypothetical protein
MYSSFSCSSAAKYFTSFVLQRFLLMMTLFFQKFLGTILGNLSINLYGRFMWQASQILIVEGFPIPVWQ